MFEGKRKKIVFWVLLLFLFTGGVSRAFDLGDRVVWAHAEAVRQCDPRE